MQKHWGTANLLSLLSMQGFPSEFLPVLGFWVSGGISGLDFDGSVGKKKSIFNATLSVVVV